MQKYWTPNIGCNIRISLATGIPEYDEYVKSISWATRRGLRNCVGDGRVGYFGSQARKYPKAILPQMIKLRPDSVPLYPGHEEKSAYFPFGETAVTDLLEGQLAFLHHVRSYEEAHPGTRFMQRNLCWKFEFLNCCIGSLPKEQLDEISSEINAVVQLGGSPNSWAVRSSKAMSKALRHTPIIKLGHYLEASMEQLEKHTSLKPFSWEPRKFFSFLMANSKGRFQTWIAPAACSYKRFLDWDFVVGISAIQGHSRVPEQVSEAAQGESNGLSIRATRKGWQRHRVAIHFTYAGGTESPGPGTVIRYGANTFYARLDYESFFNHGHELFLTDNGVVLCYQDIAPMYLTFHYRPPHEQDPGGLKHEEKQRAAGVSSSFEEETPSAAADSSEPTGGSPSGEEPVRRVQQKAMPKKKAKAKASTDAESATGGSPSGEVPVVDEAALRRLIREDELREEAARRPTTSEGTARYAYEAGDTVHGRVDAARLQQEEELRDIIQKARYNPWHFFHHGLLHRKDQSGNQILKGPRIQFVDLLLALGSKGLVGNQVRVGLFPEGRGERTNSHRLELFVDSGEDQRRIPMLPQRRVKQNITFGGVDFVLTPDVEILPMLLDVSKEVWPVGDRCDDRGKILPNRLELSPHIPFQTESIVQSELDGIVGVVGLRLL